jgi:hypothetical protein
MWVLIYAVGAMIMFASSIKFAATKDDYDWDMEDSSDVVRLCLVAFISACAWPLVLAGGIVMALVKRAYLRVDNQVGH